MRKIITPQEKEKKDKRNKILIGIVLVILMVFSTAGFALLSGEKTQENKFDYNGNTFYKTSTGWMTVINGKQFDFQYSPLETPDIKIPVEISLGSYSNKPIFLVSDYADANYEVARNLGKYAERVNQACLESQNCSGDLPIKTCNDTIIEIEEANATTIRTEGKCVFIHSEDMIKTVDAFLYKILGIKNS